MKRTIKRIIVVMVMVIVIGFLCFAILKKPVQRMSSTLFFSQSAMERVIEYKDDVETELKKYDLVEMTPIVLSIMYQESKGEGTDPMQSSESAGLSRNEIDNVSESIEQGVKHFAQMYELGVKKGVDISTIVQSYNYGAGYISFVAENGLMNSEELAKAYSMSKVEANPTLYTCSGVKGDFRYPYCYGDYTYATKVMARVSLFEEELSK